MNRANAIGKEPKDRKNIWFNIINHSRFICMSQRLWTANCFFLFSKQYECIFIHSVYMLFVLSSLPNLVRPLFSINKISDIPIDLWLYLHMQFRLPFLCRWHNDILFEWSNDRKKAMLSAEFINYHRNSRNYHSNYGRFSAHSASISLARTKIYMHRIKVQGCIWLWSCNSKRDTYAL